MPTFIKAGFWETLCQKCTGYKGWLNLDKLIESKIPPTPGPTYKVYTAKILMGNGIATVFENTLGVTITWTASSGQISTGTVAGLIGQNNVYVQVSSSTPSGSPKIVSGDFTPSPWRVIIQQTDNAGVADSTQQVYVEIRVYP
jgi:hypothetical protein